MCLQNSESRKRGVYACSIPGISTKRPAERAASDSVVTIERNQVRCSASRQFASLCSAARGDQSSIHCGRHDPARSGQPYTTNLPLARATEDDVLLARTWEGRPPPREHGGPARVITPKLYAWKGTKWARRIEFLPRDEHGFRELRGYSNTAEPCFNDRYS